MPIRAVTARELTIGTARLNTYPLEYQTNKRCATLPCAPKFIRQIFHSRVKTLYSCPACLKSYAIKHIRKNGRNEVARKFRPPTLCKSFFGKDMGDLG